MSDLSGICPNCGAPLENEPCFKCGYGFSGKHHYGPLDEDAEIEGGLEGGGSWEESLLDEPTDQPNPDAANAPGPEDFLDDEQLQDYRAALESGVWDYPMRSPSWGIPIDLRGPLPPPLPHADGITTDEALDALRDDLELDALDVTDFLNAIMLDASQDPDGGPEWEVFPADLRDALTLEADDLGSAQAFDAATPPGQREDGGESEEARYRRLNGLEGYPPGTRAPGDYPEGDEPDALKDPIKAIRYGGGEWVDVPPDPPAAPPLFAEGFAEAIRAVIETMIDRLQSQIAFVTPAIWKMSDAEFSEFMVGLEAYVKNGLTTEWEFPLENGDALVIQRYLDGDLRLSIDLRKTRPAAADLDAAGLAARAHYDAFQAHYRPETQEGGGNVYDLTDPYWTDNIRLPPQDATPTQDDGTPQDDK